MKFNKQRWMGDEQQAILKALNNALEGLKFEELSAGKTLSPYGSHRGLTLRVFTPWSEPGWFKTFMRLLRTLEEEGLSFCVVLERYNMHVHLEEMGTPHTKLFDVP